MNIGELFQEIAPQYDQMIEAVAKITPIDEEDEALYFSAFQEVLKTVPDRNEKDCTVLIKQSGHQEIPYLLSAVVSNGEIIEPVCFTIWDKWVSWSIEAATLSKLGQIIIAALIFNEMTIFGYSSRDVAIAKAAIGSEYD